MESYRLRHSSWDLTSPGFSSWDRTSPHFSNFECCKVAAGQTFSLFGFSSWDSTLKKFNTKISFKNINILIKSKKTLDIN